MNYRPRLPFSSSRGFRSLLTACLLSAGMVAAPEALFVRLGQAEAQAVTVFSRIDVSGNRRIAADTIRSIADIPTGSRVTPGQVNAGVQRLVASGLFETVSTRQDRGRLIIEVNENPTINRISIEGNRRIEDKVLLPLIGSQPRRAYTAAQAERDVEAILQAYETQGRITAQVTPKIIRRTDNRVDLVFEVFEGRVTEVKRISFVGNRHFSDRRLRRVLATKQARRLSFLFKNDTFIRDRIAFDQQQLKDFYLSRGFIDAQVISAVSDLTRERNAFLLTFKVVEGQQYRFGEISITSPEPDVDPDLYTKDIDIRTGRVYNPNRVETILERMDQRSAANGLPFIQSVPRIVRNDDTRTIDIEFELVRGPRIYVERIDIEGNSTTLDRVIRRQFNLIEGDALNRREVKLANDRLRALDYFENVEVEIREGSALNRAIVDVNVEEKPTGSLNFGLSYNTASGLGAQISLIERNFLGRGQTLSAAIGWGTDNRDISLGFQDPSIFDGDLGAGFSIYYRETISDVDSSTLFDTKRIGFEPYVTFPLGHNADLRLGYRISRDEIIINDGNRANISDVIEADEGATTTSALTARYVFDKRNSVVEPTAGFIASVNAQFAGLGGDEEYLKTWANAKAYRSFFGEDLVLSAELEGGGLFHFGDGSRIIDRFALGGDSLRGFENNGIGPRDVATTGSGVGGAGTDDALRGNYFAVMRLEASFPIGLPEEYGIYGGLFLDVGSVWGLDNNTAPGGVVIDDDAHLRAAIGFSVFWDTQFGPLRFNFAKPLKKQEYDRTETFRFTVSTRF